VTFPEGAKVRTLVITVVHTVAAPADESAALAITFNAADATDAANKLTASDSEGLDTERYILLPNTVSELAFDSHITNAYFKSIGAGSETLLVQISGGCAE
jgi:hypothetical protein